MVAEPAIPKEPAAPPAEAQASLRFVGRDVYPDRVSEVLGIKPTAERWPGGEKPNGTHQNPYGMWRLDSPLPPAAPLSDHLDWLISVLTPVAEKLQILREHSGYRGSFYCGYFFSNDQGEQVQLTAHVLEGAAALGVDLDIRVYDDSEPTADTNTP